MSLANLTVREMSAHLRQGRIDSVELLDSVLDVALKGSCITFCNEQSFEEAREIDSKRVFWGGVSPISGIPFSAKDNIMTKNILTTCNSRSLKTNTPTKNAYCVENLLNSGAVLVAKNCMREFSVGMLEDSAFELRNYFHWSGTNENVNIGAFALGTDLGLPENQFGLWVFKPGNQKMLTDGIITGSETLEKLTLITKHADDILFLLPFLTGKGFNYANFPEPNKKLDLSRYKVLVYDNMGQSLYVQSFLENAGFNVYKSDCRFLHKSDILHEVILSTEFFETFSKLGEPKDFINGDKFAEKETLRNRIEGFGFEVKKYIIAGAHLLSEAKAGRTSELLERKKNFVDGILKNLEVYDFIAAPQMYGDRLSKASAIAGLCELTVPYADVFPIKLVTRPERQSILIEVAQTLEKKL